MIAILHCPDCGRDYEREAKTEAEIRALQPLINRPVVCEELRAKKEIDVGGLMTGSGSGSAPSTSTSRERSELKIARCPLCDCPLTVVEPDDPKRQNHKVSEELRDIVWAGCFHCQILAVEPFVDWYAFAAGAVNA